MGVSYVIFLLTSILVKLQEIVQLLLVSSDVNWDCVCIRSGRSWMLGYILETGALRTGRWERFWSLLPCWSRADLWWVLSCSEQASLLCYLSLKLPPSRARSPPSLPALTDVAETALGWPQASFSPDLSEYMKPTVSQQASSHATLIFMFASTPSPRTLLLKSKMRERKGKKKWKERKRGRERGR